MKLINVQNYLQKSLKALLSFGNILKISADNFAHLQKSLKALGLDILF